MQERCNSIANALELRLSCTNSSICDQYVHNIHVPSTLIIGEANGTKPLPEPILISH